MWPPYMSYYTSQQVQMLYRELHLTEERPRKTMMQYGTVLSLLINICWKCSSAL